MIFWYHWVWKPRGVLSQSLWWIIRALKTKITKKHQHSWARVVEILCYEHHLEMDLTIGLQFCNMFDVCYQLSYQPLGTNKWNNPCKFKCTDQFSVIPDFITKQILIGMASLKKTRMQKNVKSVYDIFSILNVFLAVHCWQLPNKSRQIFLYFKEYNNSGGNQNWNFL